MIITLINSRTNKKVFKKLSDSERELVLHSLMTSKFEMIDTDGTVYQMDYSKNPFVKRVSKAGVSNKVTEFTYFVEEV